MNIIAMIPNNFGEKMTKENAYLRHYSWVAFDENFRRMIE